MAKGLTSFMFRTQAEIAPGEYDCPDEFYIAAKNITEALKTWRETPEEYPGERDEVVDIWSLEKGGWRLRRTLRENGLANPGRTVSP